MNYAVCTKLSLISNIALANPLYHEVTNYLGARLYNTHVIISNIM